MNKNFVVYKSSAGSGKTTTLVKEYLKLSLTNPDNFRHILAITFTNKAANEMKNRILEILTKITKKEFTGSAQKELLAETGLSEEQMKMRAAQLLHNIIHHYDEFSVSTIDSFVHQIVRTFSPDLKLPQGFEVLIDQEDIIPFIVEDIYDKLGRDKAFTDILLQFVLSQVEDEKSYDLNKKLSDFTKTQLGETDSATESMTKLTPADFLERIRRLQAGLATLRASIQKRATDSLESLRRAGLAPEDFKGGKRGSVGSYLVKIEKWPSGPVDLLPKSTVLKALENNEWYAKSQTNDKKTRIEGLVPFLKANLQAIRKEAERYLFLRLVYNNIYEMALIGEIRQLFEAFTERTRKVHISEFNKRIHREIAGQPVPFIYERLGRRYRHFLIDEFQDTSVLQWSNLLPLIEESLANGQFNMLVGDAKQSIYRFRHGEVELFTHLPHLFGLEDTPENRQRQQVLEQNFNPKKLKINYRSRQQIIDFNNRFFRIAGQGLSEDFRQVYEDVEQQPPEPPKPGGFVAIDFVAGENADSFRTARLDKVLEIVQELRMRQIPLNDICILTLKNDSAAALAAHLLLHNVPVITSESLLLTTSPAVRATAAVMKLLADENNPLLLAEFLTALLQLYPHGKSFYQLYTEAIGRKKALSFLLEKFSLQLPTPDVLRTKSVYEIAAEIMRHLVPSETPDPFMLFFLDFIFEKEPVYYGSLPAFLQLWEEKKEKQSIVFPEGLDSVQIMTVHKAKGLKFNIVIADLHEMGNQLTREQYWEKANIPELEGISSVLLKISDKELSALGKHEVYAHERAKTDLDFLNKVYVAFTRAVDGLFIIGSRIPRNGDAFSQKLENYLQETGLETEETMHFEWGSLPQKTETAVSRKEAEILSRNFSAPWYEFLDVAPVEEGYWEALGQNSPRAFGKLLHAILAKIRRADDIVPQLTAWQVSGLLTREEAETLRPLLQRITNHPELQEFYSSEVLIKNETELYDTFSGSFKRPDRIVVAHGKLAILDYKTGTRDPKSESKYRRQIKGYADIFRRMGYTNIEKKLIYLHENKVEIVEVE